MSKLPKDCIERIYAGWLGKVIGVRHGSNIEGWSSEKIERAYGEVKDYLFDFKNFAADDDTNGPIFFIRALEHFTHTTDLTSEQIALTLLNYVPHEHGFFWWGKYGASSESTSYHNLRNGIMPPRSGSVEQNGAIMAEQIGGQIFSDTWGLVVPGNPSLAADYARKASCVTHGGNGVYGGMFIAACISEAFIETDMERIIHVGLSVIPEDCTYTVMVRDVLRFYKSNPQNWRECFQFIKKEYWRDKYPGGCHIIPNSAIIVLSLLYGAGDFSNTINICNMCGWDTDCNVANAATIMGVRNGLEGIDYKWRKPINDILACSSVVGSLNQLDICWCAFYIANMAYKIAGEQPPENWVDILSGKAARFNFELPGSTHGFRIASDVDGRFDCRLENSTEYAHSGKGSLKAVASPMSGGNELRVYYKTYYRPDDFNDSRYDPSFSPVLYPGQAISGSVMIPENPESSIVACMYVKDGNSGTVYESDKVVLTPGKWEELQFRIPRLEGACIEEAGVKFIPRKAFGGCTVIAYVDDFDFSGKPDYTIDFLKERIEFWNLLHMDVSQFTYLKGIWELENGAMSLSSCDFGEAYTGGYDWTDYSFEATIIPQLGANHNINCRVQGAIRSYAVGLAPDNKLVLYKNENGYRTLNEVAYEWDCGKEYRIKVEVNGPTIKVSDKTGILIEFADENKPYLSGQIGVSIQNGSHCHYKDFDISTLE